MTSLRHHRAGITLLEVLISIGVLTIGLVSVLSLVPAGRSYAVKATIYDRATAVAENAIADVITRGYLDPVRFSLSTAKPSRIDHLGLASGSPLGGAAFDPIASSTGWAVSANALPVPFAVCSSSDDLVFTIPSTDDPPSPGRTSSGLPVAENRFSWVATIMNTNGSPITPIAPGAPALLSVVVFHRRDLTSTGFKRYEDNQPNSSVVANSATLTIEPASGSSDKDYLRSGSAILIRYQGTNASVLFTWRRTRLVTFGKDVGGKDIAFVTVDGQDLPNSVTDVYAFTGAVGLAERVVHLESPSPWSLP